MCIRDSLGNGYSGGGGGSYNIGVNQENVEGENEGDGYIVILPIGQTEPDCNLGCTDYHAENYDETATEDDGSCFYVGCMDELACNYDPQAMEDDGSCSYEYDCAGICGGSFILDACDNCYDPSALIELEDITYQYTGLIETYLVPDLSLIHI